MDELDKFLKTIDLNLDAEEEEDDREEQRELSNATASKGTSGYRGESPLQREKRMESILRHDLVAPHVIQFSSSYHNSRRRLRRTLAGFLVLSLSITGLLRFSSLVLAISRESTLDIDSQMKAVNLDPNTTTTTTTTDSTKNNDSRNNTRQKS